MPARTLERDVLDRGPACLQAFDRPFDAVGMEQEIVWLADQQHRRLDPLEPVRKRAATCYEKLIGLHEIEEVIGVRSLRPRRTGGVKCRLYCVAFIKTVGRVLALLGPFPIECGIGPLPVLRMHGYDLEGLGEAGKRWLLAVVVAAVPFRVEPDGGRPDVAP